MNYLRCAYACTVQVFELPFNSRNKFAVTICKPVRKVGKAKKAAPVWMEGGWRE